MLDPVSGTIVAGVVVLADFGFRVAGGQKPGKAIEGATKDVALMVGSVFVADGMHGGDNSGSGSNSGSTSV